MTEQIDRYPLSWPTGWKRTPPEQRAAARFVSYRRKISPAEAVRRLENEIERLRGTDPILSTNLRLRLDGMVRSDLGEPTDPGAAVYFKLRDRPVAFACDRWLRVADNVAALAAHIDALRRIERYGVGTVEQVFAGYAALPPKPSWWEVLGLPANATRGDVDQKFRELSKATHPDRPGGDPHQQARLSEARVEAYRALGATS